ncbi:hypothetical protein [Nisaea sediminum]|uniref:hypothetical protein n=1 Tax=Nisaea sediminum TaxID=2775867 RepID=UPI0018683F08|nr:hypothetical protein [Nisaea sediminum]
MPRYIQSPHQLGRFEKIPVAESPVPVDLITGPGGVQMKHLGIIDGVACYWAEPGKFEKPGIHYWDGVKLSYSPPRREFGEEAARIAERLLAGTSAAAAA